MTRILTGGVMGTLMWANVWFIIWPAQQLVISSAEQVAAGGDPIPEAAAAGGRAGMASRTNVLFSIPMLFFMGSASHLVWFDTGTNDVLYWVIAGVVMAAVEFNALIGAGRTNPEDVDNGQGNNPRGLRSDPGDVPDWAVDQYLEAGFAAFAKLETPARDIPGGRSRFAMGQLRGSGRHAVEVGV